MKNIDFVGDVFEEFDSFEDGYNCYCDVRNPEDGSRLIEKLRYFEGKRVRVRVEVIEEDDE